MRSMTLAGLTALTSAIYPSVATAEVTLYPGEETLDVAGFPTVSFFLKGDADKPLVVFAPGGAHMARISYGGHEGSDPQQFLAYWLNRLGYSFLALSYPMRLEHAAYEGSYPEYTAEDWGRQIVETSKQKIEENGLPKEIVTLHWSMGGKVVQPAYRFARDEGIDVPLAVSLAATPGIPGLISYFRERTMDEDGYSAAPDPKIWQTQHEEVANVEGGVAPVPWNTYETEYVGAYPVGIQGYGQLFRNGTFEADVLTQALHYGAFDFFNYPLVAALEGDKQSDYRHAFGDCVNWMVYNAATISRMASTENADIKDANQEDWRNFLALTNSLDERLCKRVDGNHFLFLGKRNAERTAHDIAAFLEEARALRSLIAKLAGSGK